MLKSKKDSKDMNANLVYTQIGKYHVFQDLLSFTVHDDQGKEYSIKALLEKILELENTIDSMNSLIEKNKSIVDQYAQANNRTESLIAKATDLISQKISALEIEVNELKDKTQYL